MTSSETPGYTFKPAIVLIICTAFLISFHLIPCKNYIFQWLHMTRKSMVTEYLLAKVMSLVEQQ